MYPLIAIAIVALSCYFVAAGYKRRKIVAHLRQQHKVCDALPRQLFSNPFSQCHNLAEFSAISLSLKGTLTNSQPTPYSTIRH